MSTRARVVVLGTGGTIAAVDGPGGAVPTVDVGDLVGRADTVDVVVDTRTVLSVDSSAMTPELQMRILQAVTDTLVDPAVAGVVVAHGTDTLEETAMLLDLVHDDPRPVVLTGAQRTASHPESDGPANLSRAIALAADRSVRERGVLVAVGGAVLPARGVTKTSTTDLNAFDAPWDTPTRPLMPPATGRTLPRVDLLTAHPGMDAGLVDAVVERGAAGLVVAGFGSGNVHPDLAGRLAAAVHDGTAVVVTSRVPGGRVTPAYGGGGGAVDLQAAGVLISPWLRAPQARVVVQQALARGWAAERISPFLDLHPTD
ncbi:asparaginase [Williamsia sp. SKLECPSW1]